MNYRTNKTLQPLVSSPIPTMSQPIKSELNEKAETMRDLASTANNNLSTFQPLNIPKKDSSAQLSNTDTTEGESSVMSDENTKAGSCLGEGGKDLLDCIAKLDEYVYQYKDEAKMLPGAEEKGAVDGTFIGPLAQDLAENPVTSACVQRDPETGFLTVDIKHLALTEMSLISQMAKRIDALEAIIKGE